MNTNYQKNLLNELRVVIISDVEVALTDERLCKAMTVNENLKSLGYQLKPKDIIKLASNESLESFWDNIKSLVITDLPAKPMYPDYPTQVMNIDEAEFRFHQMVHYFSTYGLEYLFDVEVSKGWLPTVEDTEKTEADSSLLEAKTIELLLSKDMYVIPAERILSKRERMTIPEIEIVIEAIPNINEEVIATFTVPFKENLIEIFHNIMISNLSSDIKINVITSICQHTGDVWKCLEFYIGKYKRYKLSTSEKRTIVKIFESYPVEDFRANLIISNKNARRIITLLEFLSYNKFSRSEEHKKAIYDLRNSSLKSWNSIARYLVDSKDSSTVSFIGKRPGILLRMVNELVSKGFDVEEIKSTLIDNAASLSMQTLVSVVTYFEKDIDRDETLINKVNSILYAVIHAKMKAKNTPLINKKVFIDTGMISLEHSVFDKSEEGGYLRSGMAIKIPEHINNIRFFCYWNDNRRIDIDLHAYGMTKDNNPLHIGWNSSYRTMKCDAIFSGDITHSNAAEYIDINMNSKDIDYISFDLTSFTRVAFKDIDTVYTGLMAVNSLGKKIKLYDPKNCIITHELKGNKTDIHYGRLDVPNRLLILEAQTANKNLAIASREKPSISKFTMKTYLDMLFASQNVEVVSKAEDADIILSITKPEVDNGISLIDSNFFMED